MGTVLWVLPKFLYSHREPACGSGKARNISWSGFLNLSTINFLGQIILCYWRLSCTYTMISSIPDFHTPEGNSTHTLTSCYNQKCLWTLPNIPRGANSPLVENHCFRFTLPLFLGKSLNLKNSLQENYQATCAPCEESGVVFPPKGDQVHE